MSPHNSADFAERLRILEPPRYLSLGCRLLIRMVLVCLPCACLVLCISVGPTHGAEVFNRVMKSGTVRIGVPYNLIPQGFFNESNQWGGFEVDLARELARHMNVKPSLVKINERTWKPALLSGKIDAAFCRIRHTRSLESEVDFSVPYFYDVPHLLMLRGKLTSKEELKGHKIAAVQGSPAEKLAMGLLRDMGDTMAQKNVISYPDRSSSFFALGREKVSAWLDSGMILLEYCSKNPDRFRLVRVDGSVDPVAVAVPENDSEWRDFVNFSLQDMAGDGSFKKIYDKWLGAGTPYEFPMPRNIDIWPE